MSDNKVTELSDELRAKLKAIKKVRKLSDSDEWTIPQLILQDIQANEDFKEAMGESPLPLTDQIKVMKDKIEEEFGDDAEIKQVILASIPSSYEGIRLWTKSKEWQDIVMDKIRNNNTFKNSNRTKVLENILKLATTPNSASIKAAELYFKLEGTLNKENKEGSEVDNVFERFRDLQKTLHNKK